MVDRAAFGAWIESYERAWRAEGTAGLAELFTEDATYLHSPYEKPVAGLAAIARDWEAERDGPAEVFTMAAEIVAVDGDTGVARVEVRYGTVPGVPGPVGGPLRRGRAVFGVRGVAVLAGPAVEPRV